MVEICRANAWKRISAALFDLILVAIVGVGVMYGLSLALGYSAYSDSLTAIQEKYEAELDVDFGIGAEEYNALSSEDKARYDAAFALFSDDPDASFAYRMMINLSLIIITFGLLAGFLAVEFAVPVILKNGQTLGKKVFGVAVMRKDGVRLSPLLLFARTLLGKYTLETMLPVLIIIMVYFGLMGVFGTFVIVAMLGVQLVLFCATNAHTVLHDLLSQTVTVDMATQMIFESPAERDAYYEKNKSNNGINQV